jgi:hypothetical protein
MSNRKLWKIISISNTKGSRISKSMSYGDAAAKFQTYRSELAEGDKLYMIQVLDIAVGRAALAVGYENPVEEIFVEAPEMYSRF